LGRHPSVLGAGIKTGAKDLYASKIGGRCGRRNQSALRHVRTRDTAAIDRARNVRHLQFRNFYRLEQRISVQSRIVGSYNGSGFNL